MREDSCGGERGGNKGWLVDEERGGCGTLDVGPTCNIDSMAQVCREVLQRTSFIKKTSVRPVASLKCDAKPPWDVFVTYYQPAAWG